jgi:hypothetical protein
MIRGELGRGDLGGGQFEQREWALVVAGFGFAVGDVNGSRPPATSPPSSASTRTPCSAPSGRFVDEGLLEFRRGRGITVAAAPQQGAVVEQARNLVQFARRNGYELDELIQVIQTVG